MPVLIYLCQCKLGIAELLKTKYAPINDLSKICYHYIYTPHVVVVRATAFRCIYQKTKENGEQTVGRLNKKSKKQTNVITMQRYPRFEKTGAQWSEEHPLGEGACDEIGRGPAIVVT